MRSRLTRFFAILSVLMIYTAWKCSTLWPSHPDAAVSLALPLFALMIGPMFVYRFDADVFDRLWFQAYVWIGSILLGIWATFILLSLPLDAFRLLLLGAGHVSSGTAAFLRPALTLLSSQGLGLALLGFSLCSSAFGLWQALRGPRVREIRVPVSVPSLHGLRLAQISDLHVGPTIRKRYVEEVVRRVNETHPDLVLVTGDLADAKAESIAEHLAPLAGLKSRFGAFYATGNHEYYWGVDAILEKIRALGLEPLLNENRVLRFGETKFLVAGVTDPMGEHFPGGHRPDLRRAIRAEDETPFKILLAHRPETCLEAEPIGFDLQLSGHTHAGQFFPFSLLVKFAHKFHRGLHRHGRMWVYVNPGTAYWGPANRFAISPEISLLRLGGE